MLAPPDSRRLPSGSGSQPGSIPILSLTASRSRWLQPRHFSVVWTDTWPSRNWICSSSPPESWQSQSRSSRNPWLVPAAQKAGLGRIGWHTFRHSHSTLLHALGVDLKVQQELLRHADIRTTMNIYTQAVPTALREANSKVVRLVLPAQVA